jgi:orotidine-5'-phosphate decarboxylase
MSAAAGHERILVALDTPEAGRARSQARLLAGHVGGFKVGIELFTSHGLALVRELGELGHAVFLDLKFHDIPNSVAGAAAAAARAGVSMFTLHALGGSEMIRRAAAAAAEAAHAAGKRAPCVLAVTVLTSHDDATLERLGLEGPCSRAVLRLVALAREAGAGGIVCSPLEVAAVRAAFPAGLLVVPGIRPAGAAARDDDQSRVATPAEAVRLGADRLVVGRPITEAGDPLAAASAIAEEIRRGERA